jgi:hypothetical protein
MWIRSLVVISGNEVTDGLARQAVESGTVHGQMVVANDHRIFVRQAMVSNVNMFGGQEILPRLAAVIQKWAALRLCHNFLREFGLKI